MVAADVAAVVSEIPDGAVVVDVRWYLDGRDGLAAFEAGHIPGARWVDLDRALAATDLPSTEGRHPLPSPDAFAASMAALGIGDDTWVVAYDDTGGLTAGRLVVMLRMIGRRGSLLDGGLVAWIAAGRPVAVGPAAPPDAPATFTPVPWPRDRVVSGDEAAVAAAHGGAVLDARVAERFTGEVALIDRRVGHVPGARERAVGVAPRRRRPAAPAGGTARALLPARCRSRRCHHLLRLGCQRVPQHRRHGARRSRAGAPVRRQLVGMVGRSPPAGRARHPLAHERPCSARAARPAPHSQAHRLGDIEWFEAAYRVYLVACSVAVRCCG